MTFCQPWIKGQLLEFVLFSRVGGVVRTDQENEKMTSDDDDGSKRKKKKNGESLQLSGVPEGIEKNPFQTVD